MKTIKTKQPKKLGRPSVYAQPMSNKERQQRYRDKVKADAQKLLQVVSL